MKHYYIQITVDQVLTLHDKAINKDGGDAGIRDINLVESALNFLYLDEYTIPEIAGKLLYRFCVNHAFIDGNKRTALLVSHYFLKLNEYRYNGNEHDIYQLIINISNSSVSELDTMAHFFHFCQKKNP